MASEMVRLINGQLNTNKRVGVDVHCLWCIDHRLNLVAQDLREVPNINFVITFIKWITASDRLVSYTLFVRRKSTPKPRKIPPPSETRWLFYRDSLRAILEQTETIEEFSTFPRTETNGLNISRPHNSPSGKSKSSRFRSSTPWSMPISGLPNSSLISLAI